MRQEKSDLTWRVLLLGAVACAVTAAAIPYVVLKLGMTVDLTYGGMFFAAAVLGRFATSNKQLAVQLNIIQTMINVVIGIAFMVIILAAFFYIQTVFGKDVGFNPKWWQMTLFLSVSAILGVFAGILPRSMILKDRSLPWPTADAVYNVIQPLSDSEGEETSEKRRNVLTVSTGAVGFLTFLKEGLGVITPMVGNGAMKVAFSLEFAAIGLGMLIPLSVGLSGLLGVWVLDSFGESVAQFSALSDTLPQAWEYCHNTLAEISSLPGVNKTQAMELLSSSCGPSAVEYASDTASHFKYVVQWMMWPATAMMIAASLASVIIPFVKKIFSSSNAEESGEVFQSKADETIPKSWIIGGMLISVGLIVWMSSSWFGVPWEAVLLAVAIQPILIIAGLRVLGLTGAGPVSLMANATQFMFGLIWPAHVRGNLVSAYISANPQASSEAIIPSFWVAQRVGGKFKTLIVAMLIMIPIGALITPLVFDLLQQTYGIGLKPGQLAAPTGLKIASLAMVMEQGLDALPHWALEASIIAIFVGIIFEILLAIPKRDADGEIILNDKGGNKLRFWWVPIPTAFGFALILPPVLMIMMAVGSVITAAWKKLSPEKKGSFALFGKPLAAGLVAGEAIVAGILLPLIGILFQLFE